MLNTEKLKTIPKTVISKTKSFLSQCKIRDAKTDKYASGLLEKDYILSGKAILALIVLGFVLGIIFIVLLMCTI